MNNGLQYRENFENIKDFSSNKYLPTPRVSETNKKHKDEINVLITKIKEQQANVQALQEQIDTKAISMSKVINDSDDFIGKNIIFTEAAAFDIYNALIPVSIVPVDDINALFSTSFDTPNNIEIKIKIYYEATHLSHPSDFQYVSTPLVYSGYMARARGSLMSNLNHSIKTTKKINYGKPNTTISTKLPDFSVTGNFTSPQLSSKKDWDGINFLSLGFNGRLYFGINVDMKKAIADTNWGFPTPSIPNILEYFIKKYPDMGKESPIEITEDIIKNPFAFFTNPTANFTQHIKMIENIGPSSSIQDINKIYKEGSAKPSDYLGCYQDGVKEASGAFSKIRHLPKTIKSVRTGTVEQCVAAGRKEGYTIVGLQYGGPGQAGSANWTDGNCVFSTKTKEDCINDDCGALIQGPEELNDPKCSNKANNIKGKESGYCCNGIGGGWANAIYQINDFTNYISSLRIHSFADNEASTGAVWPPGSILFEYIQDNEKKTEIIWESSIWLNKSVLIPYEVPHSQDNYGIYEILSNELSQNFIYSSEGKQIGLYSNDGYFKFVLDETAASGIKVNVNTDLIKNHSNADDLLSLLSQDTNNVYQIIYKIPAIDNSRLGAVGFINYSNTQDGTSAKPYQVSQYSSDKIHASSSSEKEKKFIEVKGSLNNIF